MKKNLNKIIVVIIIVLVSIFGINRYNIKQQELFKKKQREIIEQQQRLLQQQKIAEERKHQENWKQVFKEVDKQYPIIKMDKNDKYEGVGQETIKNQQGYFNTFTTIEKNKKTYIEYKQNGNSPWKNNEYWGDTMENTGCGIITMSILLSGYGHNYTPEDLRKKYFPVMNYDNLSSELLNEFDINSTNFYYGGKYFKKETILEHLYSNRPIIICVWNQKENRWTRTSHFMILLAAEDDMVYVSNPNGLLNSSKSSGWYNIDEILPYLAKIMYITSY